MDWTDETTSCCRGTSIHFGTRFESDMKLLDMSFNKSLLHLNPWCNFNILGTTTLGSCSHCHRLDSYGTKFVKVRLQFGIVTKKFIIFKKLLSIFILFYISFEDLQFSFYISPHVLLNLKILLYLCKVASSSFLWNKSSLCWGFFFNFKLKFNVFFFAIILWCNSLSQPLSCQSSFHDLLNSLRIKLKLLWWISYGFIFSL